MFIIDKRNLSNSMVRVIVIDDHEIILQGLCALLSKDEELEIVKTFTNPQLALDYLETHKVDVLITDLDMSNLSGEDVLMICKSKFPSIKVIMLSIHKEPSIIRQLVKLGADGYLTKNASHVEYLNAITTVSNGKKYFNSEVVDSLLGDNKPVFHQNAEGLSSREIEIMILIAQGLTSKQIGRDLNISSRTVDTHRVNIQAKIKEQGTAGIIRYAFSKGLIS